MYSVLSNIVRTWCLVSGTRLNFQLLLRPLPDNYSAYATTKLHELKTALSVSRGEWRCKQGASTDVLQVEIDGASVACKGQTTTHTYRKYNIF